MFLKVRMHYCEELGSYRKVKEGGDEHHCGSSTEAESLAG